MGHSGATKKKGEKAKARRNATQSTKRTEVERTRAREPARQPRDETAGKCQETEAEERKQQGNAMQE